MQARAHFDYLDAPPARPKRPGVLVLRTARTHEMFLSVLRADPLMFQKKSNPMLAALRPSLGSCYSCSIGLCPNRI